MTKHALSAAAPTLSKTFFLARGSAPAAPQASGAPQAAKILRICQNCEFSLPFFEALEGWDPGGFT